MDYQGEKTGVLAATEAELEPLLACLENVSTKKHAMLTVYEGSLDAKIVVAVSCGVCKVNAAVAAQVLIDLFGVTRVAMIGAAGRLDARLKIGDVVVSDTLAYHDIKGLSLNDYHPYFTEPDFKVDSRLLERAKAVASDLAQTVYFGRIVTGEAFVVDEGRQEIIDLFNPLCVDMESTAAAHVCYLNGIPFIAIRAVSDTEDESGIGAFEDNLKLSADNAFAVLRALLRRL